MLILAVHNTIRYLFKLRIKKSLIISFYGFVVATSLLKCCIFAIAAANPPESLDSDFIESLQLWSLAYRFSIVLEMCTGITIYLTLQKLSF